jgi:hypothetical protein
MSLTRQEIVDSYTKLSIQKIADAAENAFAERAILLDENSLLFGQNKEKTTLTSMKHFCAALPPAARPGLGA